MEPQFGPIKKIKASEQIVEGLLNSILAGGVSPGDKLPPERVLARQFHVNRTTLREALKKLEQMKLIAIRQGQGILVEDYQTASVDLLFYLLKVNGEIDVHVLKNLLEARELFGKEVARLAARRADRKDIKQMRSLMKRLVKAGDPHQLQLLDFEFFRQLALASKNIVYVLLMNTIRSIHSKHLPLFLPLTASLDTSLQQEILRAVIEGDEEGAAEKAGAFLHPDRELIKFMK